jgi:hypothetical protein
MASIDLRLLQSMRLERADPVMISKRLIHYGEEAPEQFSSLKVVRIVAKVRARLI